MTDDEIRDALKSKFNEDVSRYHDYSSGDLVRAWQYGYQAGVAASRPDGASGDGAPRG